MSMPPTLSPFPELLQKVPTASALLRLTALQMDELLLKLAADRASNPDPVAPKFVYDGSLTGLYPVGQGNSFADSSAADKALGEAWGRLQAAGLVMQAPGQALGNRTVTTRGAAVASSSSFQEMAVRQRLSREMLHPALQGAVYDSFAAGHYDTAVRDASVVLEDAVRTAAGYGTGRIGVALMRDAFNPTSGPLADMAAPVAERERMAELFAGTIGVFKNPLSHRRVGNSDPAPVMEELMLICRLLRFIPPPPP
jgi:uncharacterized protein (TIGR02391 family)